MNGKKSTAGNSVLSVFTGNTGIISCNVRYRFFWCKGETQSGN